MKIINFFLNIIVTTLFIPVTLHAMDTPGSVPSNFNSTGSVDISQIPAETKQQIQNIKNFAMDMKNKGEELYLVLGSGKDEITSLKDKTKTNNWVFWNMGGLQDGKNINAPDIDNLFVDADFNDKNILAYAAKELSGVFSKIVLSILIPEYTNWQFQDFRHWHDMLKSQGIMIFSLSWAGENFNRFSEELQEEDFPNGMNSFTPENFLKIINRINGYELQYDECENYLRKKYKSHKPILGYETRVLGIMPPAINEVIFQYQKSNLSNEEKRKIEDLKKDYIELSGDVSENIRHHQIRTTISREEKSEKSEKWSKIFNTFSGTTKGSKFSNSKIITGDEFQKLLEEAILEPKTFDPKFDPNQYWEQARENWLKTNLFGKIFSSVNVETMSYDDPRNDIPSQTQKIVRESGDTIFILTK